MTGVGVRALRAALAAALLPLAAGYLNVTYQDASMTHLPGKWATVEALRAGEFPYLNPYASFGQPLAGNPNFGTFFPDTLLFLVLPLRTAFGAHFALAALLAYAGARRWSRAEGIGRGAAETAAVAFTLSGVFVSAWKFYNTGMALAVAPWVLAALVRALRRAVEGDRRRVRLTLSELGLWVALELLAGEPVVALLTLTVAGLRLAAWLAAGPAAVAVRSALASVSTALLLGALLAAPQLLLTGQIYQDSSRDRRPFPFVTATGTSVHAARFLEQAVPFPFGRPDLAGVGGFTGHRFYDHHVPYLWTLHLGLATVALLILFGRAWRGPERLWYALAAAAIVLSLGRYLPLAKKLYPLLSVDGRIRFPVKWWYVVALCLVPVVAHAAQRWLEGAWPSPRRAIATLGLLAAALAAAVGVGADRLAVAMLILAVAATSVIFFIGGRERPSALLATALAVPLLVADLPLLLAVLDRPLPDPPRLGGARVYERVRVDAHALPGSLPPPETTTREVMRRVAPELWAISGALAGNPYAFDRDPDGSYTDPDRAVRKPLEDLPWPERAPALRQAGVAHVVTDEALPPPYREARVLSAVHGVRLYTLDGAGPSVRLATRLVHVRSPEDALPARLAPEFDGASDAVLVGSGPAVPGKRAPARFVSVRDRPARLRAEAESSRPGVLVWSRSYFGAWRAAVDGRAAETVLVDGHLVGVPVPAGLHVVEVWWSARPLVMGAVACAVGLLGTLLLRRR